MKEIHIDDIDGAFFVLTVDLWDADGNSEVNLVRHTSGGSSVTISNTALTLHPPPSDRPAYHMPSHMTALDAYGRSMPVPATQPQPYSHPHSQMQPSMPPTYYGAPAGPAPSYVPVYGNQNPYAPSHVQMAQAIVVPAPPQAPQSMYTRNLIDRKSTRLNSSHWE